MQEQLSPELVLVTPALRERALAALPERDPYAFLCFEREAARQDDEPDRDDCAGAGPEPGGERSTTGRILLLAVVYAAVSFLELLAIWTIGVAVIVAVAVLVLSVW